MTNAPHDFAEVFPAIAEADSATESKSRAPVTTPAELEFGALGPSRMGGQYSPPLPSAVQPVTRVRVLDAVIDSALAPTWALTYLPATNRVVAGDPLAGANPFTAAGLIVDPWPAASGFPLGTELLDARRARGVLQLGQGGVRSGPVLFDWSAGGVLQVPAGAVQLDVEFPLQSVGVEPPALGFYPLPPVPSFRAFVCRELPAPAQSILTERLDFLSGSPAGTLTALMFRVPLGARSWFLAGYGASDGRLEGVLTGATGRAVLFDRRGVVTHRETLTFFIQRQEPLPLPADTVAVGIQLAGALVPALPYNVSVGFGMSW